MADKSTIEWTQATWNAIVGCSVISPGCTNCYAMRQAGTFLRTSEVYRGLTEPSKAGPVWNGQVRLYEPALNAPVRWSKPRMIFVNSMGDLFHEAVPDEWVDRIFAVMARCPQHTFQVLTKRAERMRDYLNGEWHNRVSHRLLDQTGSAHFTIPLPNVWAGVSAEDQQRFDERIPFLLETPAAVRWVSAEPLLGPLNTIGWTLWPSFTGKSLALDWVVVGGESGPGARPMHPDWARSVRDQCAAAGVAFFFKQWGEFAPVGYPDGLADRPEEHLWIRIGKSKAGRLLDGVTWDEYPRGASDEHKEPSGPIQLL